MSFESLTREAEGFWGFLEDLSSFLLSLELDLDRCLLLFFDFDSTLFREEAGSCCARSRSLFLSLERDRDLDADRPRLRSLDRDLDLDLDLERDLDGDLE